jgi:predicted dehydrogenase
MTGLRWGILATGGIAHSFTHDLRIAGLDVAAVGSRSADSAARFAAEYEIPHVHASYEDLVSDPDVDIVYVSTPHPMHAENAILALEHGKHVLVEKPFALTGAEAAAVRDAAAERGLLAMEAMWTRYLPHMIRIRELLDTGALGDVRALFADHTQRISSDPSHRLNALELGGGALLDLGVYPVSFAQMLLGTPDSVQVRGLVGPTGVEMDTALLLGYDDGRWAMLDCSLRMPLAGAAAVIGTAGRIDVRPRFHHPTELVLHRVGAEPEPMSAGLVGGGYSHELVEVRDCLAAGRTESEVMPLADTLAVMGVLETALHELGLSLDEDESVEV